MILSFAIFVIICFLPVIVKAELPEEAPASIGFSNIDPDLAEQAAADEGTIELQVPIFGYIKARDIGDYIFNIYKMALYIIIPIILAIMIFAGALWAISGGDKKLIQNAKDYITHGVIGLGIILFSYIFLSFVGIKELKTPQIQKLLGISYVPPELVNLMMESMGEDIDQSNMTSDEILKLGKEIAKQLGIDPCVIVTKFKMESAGKPNAIGHDISSSATEAYRKMKGQYGGDTKCPKEPIQNTEDLGLDWRYSHGIGLGQLTFFPKGYKYWETCNNNATVVSRKFSGECFTPRMALSVKKNIETSLKLWKSKFNGSDYQTAFARYNGGGAKAAAYGQKAMKFFNQCKASGGGN